MQDPYCFAIYTYDKSDTLSTAIADQLGVPWSHCAIGFANLPEWQTKIYFESIWKIDPGTGKTGLRGPIPIGNLLDWIDVSPGNHIAKAQLIRITPEDTRRAYNKLISNVGYITYAKFQIALNFLSVNFPLTLGPRFATANKWTCSETLARVLPAELQVNSLHIGQVTYDFVVPAGHKLPSVKAGIEDWNLSHPNIQTHIDEEILLR